MGTLCIPIKSPGSKVEPGCLFKDIVPLALEYTVEYIFITSISAIAVSIPTSSPSSTRNLIRRPEDGDLIEEGSF
jgi:hypothetical protein